MSTDPTESTPVAPNRTVTFRISGDDLAPIQRAADAADLGMSAVVREALVRYGQQVIIELVQDREFAAKTSYQVSGKRRLRRSGRSKTTELVNAVAFKYDLTDEIAGNWIKLGRVKVNGEVVTDPSTQVLAEDPDAITKSE